MAAPSTPEAVRMYWRIKKRKLRSLYAAAAELQAKRRPPKPTPAPDATPIQQLPLLELELVAEPPPPAPFLSFPVIGTGPKQWVLTEDQVAAWATAYPGLDIHAECQHALAWVNASPDRRKTVRGMPRFLVTWLNRSADRPRRPSNGGVVIDPNSELSPQGQRNAVAMARAAAKIIAHGKAQRGEP